MSVVSRVLLVLLGFTLISVTSARKVSWSGFLWNTRHSGNLRLDPDGNFWDGSPGSVWVAADGSLHLKVRYNAALKRWTCAEVFMDRGTMGYGTYQFRVRSSTWGYDPNLVIGLFTYGAPIPLKNGRLKYNEIDIEFAKFRNKTATTEGKYTVQPAFRVPRTSFRNAAGTTIHQFKWMPGRVEFSSFSGPLSKPKHWRRFFSYATRMAPTPSNDRVHINFWLSHGFKLPPTNRKEAEFVIQSFRFFP